MKKHYLHISIPLIISLFIYVFYRTEKTIINELLLKFITLSDYKGIKAHITAWLPINKHVIYSLPEGLWMFSTTLVSKNFYLKITGKVVNCAYFPLVFSIGLELFQLLKITNGTFDFLDVISAAIFWFIAFSFFDRPNERINIIADRKKHSLPIILSFAIVLLSDVWI